MESQEFVRTILTGGSAFEDFLDRSNFSPCGDIRQCCITILCIQHDLLFATRRFVHYQHATLLPIDGRQM